MKLVLITGLSGAGKSVALRALEDAGFEAIDNLPLIYLPVIAGAEEETDRNLVIGADIRSRDFSPARFLEMIRRLRAHSGVELQVVFLEADADTLQQRFTETRRRHPLALGRPVTDGIHQERQLLESVAAAADLVIDTSELSALDLRRVMTGHFAHDRKLAVTVTSFSYRRGLPREADLVFDVRFLKNPHYADALRPLTGLDGRVGDYIRTDAGYAAFFEHLQALVLPLLPRYREEGKYYLTIAIGCTGGKHRSVFVACELAAVLEKAGYEVTMRHRDLEVAHD